MAAVLGDIVWAYQNASPALLAIIILGGRHIYYRDIQPRLDDLDQRTRAIDDRVDDHDITASERDVLLEHAHERVDDAESIIDRLRLRLTRLEAGFAAQHGHLPDDFSGDFTRGDPPRDRSGGDEPTTKSTDSDAEDT